MRPAKALHSTPVPISGGLRARLRARLRAGPKSAGPAQRKTPVKLAFYRGFYWSDRQDSNLRPLPPQGSALIQAELRSDMRGRGISFPVRGVNEQ